MFDIIHSCIFTTSIPPASPNHNTRPMSFCKQLVHLVGAYRKGVCVRRGDKPPRHSRYAMTCIVIGTPNTKWPSTLDNTSLPLHIDTMPQKQNIHSHGLPQIATGLLHSSQGHTVHSHITQDMKSLSPYNTVYLNSPLHWWNLLQRSNPAWRGRSPRSSSSSCFLGPLRGHSYVGLPIGELRSACAIRLRR